MLAVARAVVPSDLAIDWHEASAEAMPLSDGMFLKNCSKASSPPADAPIPTT